MNLYSPDRVEPLHVDWCWGNAMQDAAENGAIGYDQEREWAAIYLVDGSSDCYCPENLL